MAFAPHPVLAETWLGRHSDQISALVTVAVTFVLLVLVNRLLLIRGRRLATAIAGGELRPELDTRLSFVRRIVDVVIVVVGLMIALGQLPGVDRVATTILTSGAIAAAVVGFAARQTLANAIAGILLAITQPLRIGDVVTFEDQTGVVEDVRVASTWLRTAAGSRIIVPNERLASGVLRNDTIEEETIAVEASVFVPIDRDPVAAADLLRASLAGHAVSITESTHEGAKLSLTGAPALPGARAREEHALREAALRVLRDAALAGSRPAGGTGGAAAK